MDRKDKGETHMELRTSFGDAQTIYHLVSDTADQFPDRDALVVGDERLTYHQLMQRLDGLAAGLQRLGLQKGDRLGVILPACVESVYTLIAPAKIGLVIVPMNPLLRAHEVRHILADSGAVALITVAKMFGHDYLNMIETIWPKLPALRHVVVKGEPRGERVISLAELMARGEAEAGPLAEIEVKLDDVSGIFYTSGTTGLPKGAIHVYRNTVDALKNGVELAVKIAEAAGMRIISESVMTPFPLFHIAGVGTAALTLSVGGKLIIQERFVPRQALELLAREQVNVMTGSPTMYHLMLQVPDLQQYDLSALQTVGTAAAPCSPDLVKEIETRTPARVVNYYGLTEVGTSTRTTRHDPLEVRLNTVGRPRPWVQIRIVDDERQELPVGQTGEVAIHTPYAFKGYHNLPDETAQALDEEGWFYSGDVGYLDEAGCLHLMDRKKDMVIRGGENVYPAEVEHFLSTHPKVHMAAVVGVPSAVGGERLWAYIIPKQGTEPTAAEILDYCRGQIAPYKIPDEVRFVPDLPLTATRKVQKYVLREQARKELEQVG
jgi:fatty-acyl-CoA synthase